MTETQPRSFDPQDPVGTVLGFLRGPSPLFAATVGLNGRPQVRPAAFAYEDRGAFWFLTLKSSRMYAELSGTPYIQLCAGAPGSLFRLSAKVCFSGDADVIGRAAGERPDVLAEAGGDANMLIAFFLLGAEAEFSSGTAPARTLRLPDPDGVLIGITIKKKTELRDRLTRVFERREAEPLSADSETTKLYDGALLLFADAAKAVWPRMDIRPAERAAVFETWDEREMYTKRAAALVRGLRHAVVDENTVGDS